MNSIVLFFKVLMLVLKIVERIQYQHLTAETTKELLDALDANAEGFIADAMLARANVRDDPDGMRSDPYDRDPR